MEKVSYTLSIGTYMYNYRAEWIVHEKVKRAHIDESRRVIGRKTGFRFIELK